MSEAQSVLYDIKPCDLQQPYIFVSYSSMDSELVWRDVREFQRRGYNVWLDEKNLDKTKLSWRDDAIEAIEDMECELVVFYVSSHSLRSDACYQELSKTVDERTQAMHFGPVKFIAIDAEPVGDITEFSQKVFREIRGSVMQKEERNRQALALDGFMRNFFNSNNEKVRIHPKDEPGRKIDYYDDITASFPEITKVFEAETEEPVYTAGGVNSNSFSNSMSDVRDSGGMVTPGISDGYRETSANGINLQADIKEELYDIKLISCGKKFSKRVHIIKAVLDFTGLEMKEAQDLVHSAPCLIAEKQTPEKAMDLKKLIEQQDGVVELIPVR